MHDTWSMDLTHYFGVIALYMKNVTDLEAGITEESLLRLMLPAMYATIAATKAAKLSRSIDRLPETTGLLYEVKTSLQEAIRIPKA